MAPLVYVAGWALLHFVWQGAVIAAAAAIGFYVLQGANLRHIHAAWCEQKA